VILTSAINPERVTQYLRDGLKDVTVKPYSASELKRIVEIILSSLRKKQSPTVSCSPHRRGTCRAKNVWSMKGEICDQVGEKFFMIYGITRAHLVGGIFHCRGCIFDWGDCTGAYEIISNDMGVIVRGE
jgi:hypothetical protein